MSASSVRRLASASIRPSSECHPWPHYTGSPANSNELRAQMTDGPDQRLPRDKLLELYSRWGITMNSGEAFDQFKNRFLSFRPQSMRQPKPAETILRTRVANIRGESPSLTLDWAFKSADTLVEFLVAAQQFFWAIADTLSANPEELRKALILARDHSPGIDFEVAKRGDTYTVYAAGAPELDRGLIEEPLGWLSPHPEVAEHFEAALRIVLNRDEGKYRNALDNVRWSVEQLLRAVLHNQKPLESQKEALLQWLAERGVHQEIVKMYTTLLTQFATYQNDAVKHGAKWAAVEIEFVIYLTGAFMRFVLRLQAAAEVA